MAWPTVVPILDASDLCRGKFVCGKKRCLSGWVLNTFQPETMLLDGFIEGDPSERSNAVANRLIKVIAPDEAVLGKPIQALADIVDNNGPTDSRLWSFTELAGFWNTTMKKLGYVVPCNRPTGNTDA